MRPTDKNSEIGKRARIVVRIDTYNTKAIQYSDSARNLVSRVYALWFSEIRCEPEAPL